MLLREEGIEPADVRLLRHQTDKVRGRTPYTLWRDDLPSFEHYQSMQSPASHQRTRFQAPYWASFVSPPAGGTLFVGLYEVELAGTVPFGTIDPLSGEPVGVAKGVIYDQYACMRAEALASYIGRLFVHWGDAQASRAWIQRADRQDKEILELREVFQEEGFPGFTNLIRPLSELEAMPLSWQAVLSSARGVYLLACPVTREHYVGSAYGEGGFLARWRDYLANSHGGNVGLRNRERTDWQVSILEVAGSAATVEDIIRMEATWKTKLHSRTIGLNRN